MTNLLTRIKNTVLADLNEALDHKEKKNPIALLNQYLRECEQETEKVRKLIERQYRLKDEFAREYQQAADLAEKRKSQADIATKAGEQELHQFAFQEASHYEERATRLKNMLNEATAELQNLENRYEEMKHKLKDMHLRRMELMGRENVSRANQRINRVIDNDDFSDKSYSKFVEIDSYLERLEKEVTHSYNRNTIDVRIAELEKSMKKEEKLLNE